MIHKTSVCFPFPDQELNNQTDTLLHLNSWSAFSPPTNQIKWPICNIYTPITLNTLYHFSLIIIIFILKTFILYDILQHIIYVLPSNHVTID